MLTILKHLIYLLVANSLRYLYIYINTCLKFETSSCCHFKLSIILLHAIIKQPRQTKLSFQTELVYYSPNSLRKRYHVVISWFLVHTAAFCTISLHSDRDGIPKPLKRSTVELTNKLSTSITSPFTTTYNVT